MLSILFVIAGLLSVVLLLLLGSKQIKDSMRIIKKDKETFIEDDNGNEVELDDEVILPTIKKMEHNAKVTMRYILDTGDYRKGLEYIDEATKFTRELKEVLEYVPDIKQEYKNAVNDILFLYECGKAECLKGLELIH